MFTPRSGFVVRRLAAALKDRGLPLPRSEGVASHPKDKAVASSRTPKRLGRIGEKKDFYLCSRRVAALECGGLPPL